jgi:hypothetical protein
MAEVGCIFDTIHDIDVLRKLAKENSMRHGASLGQYMDICDDLSRQLDHEKKLHRQANAMRLQQMDRDSAEITRLRRQNEELREAVRAHFDSEEAYEEFLARGRCLADGNDPNGTMRVNDGPGIRTWRHYLPGGALAPQEEKQDGS